MKNILYLMLTALLLTQCDFLDPTEADPNPDLTREAIVGSGIATNPWIVGLERQLALLTQEYVVQTAIVSDNFVNTSTFYNTNFDELVIQFADADVDEFLFDVSDLRESTRVGFEVIVPSDTSTSNNDLAEIYYFRGVAFMLQAEILAFSPVEAGGAPQPAAVSFDSAIVNFNQAIALSSDGDKIPSYHIALARVYYGIGDQANAVEQANQVLMLNADYLRAVSFDNTNAPTNPMQDATYDRSNFDLQPLPRLDFLDPKYGITGANEADIPFTKAEEAYLILAEAAIADQNLADAQGYFNDLLALVATRPTRTIPEPDRRQERGGTGVRRPSGSNTVVRASADDPFVTELVLNRPDSAAASGTNTEITVPTVSGTSVTEADVAALTTLDEALELCYLLRQEIFFSEGRRMQDLGIKWPLSQNEQIQNENINEGDASLQPIIPEFIPREGVIDQFTWDRAANEVTILVNMNRLLVQNKGSELVVPFE